MRTGPVQKRTIFGQDPDVLKALWANVLSWFVSRFVPSLLPKLLPTCPAEEEEVTTKDTKDRTRCVSIGRPGGLEQLRVISLKDDIVTIGYNVKHVCLPPFTPPHVTIPSDCVLLDNHYFSVNYADCTIRWGLYESAKRFVGWPIVPGFDVAGKIIIQNDGDSEGSSAKKEGEFCDGDLAFGCTLFGAYSSKVLIPKKQLRKIPSHLTMQQAASLPTVSLTALYALHLAGHFPTKSQLTNKAILIHSAAGGVGSMLVQISKLLNLSPIVGVVGSTSKVAEAYALGCDVVIDKSTQNLWKEAQSASPPDGYATIMDANGVSTLQQSYQHLAPTGRLIVFGFHTNLPMGCAMLSPMQWIRMARKMSSMPTFHPMDMTVDNRSVLAFNLSFFANETDMVSQLFDQICIWLEQKQLRCPKVITMPIHYIGKAHELIQSGKSIGKIVIST